MKVAEKTNLGDLPLFVWCTLTLAVFMLETLKLSKTRDDFNVKYNVKYNGNLPFNFNFDFNVKYKNGNTVFILDVKVVSGRL